MLALAALSPMLAAQTAVDKVLVVKSERALYLQSQGQPLKRYRISLGKNPVGAKTHEGDQRTPEGFYWLDRRYVSERYQLAMHISYPNARDLAQAKAQNRAPGDMLLVHGTPRDAQYPEWFFHTLDWTEGCIALTNEDMQAFWAQVADGTLIEIRP